MKEAIVSFLQSSAVLLCFTSVLLWAQYTKGAMVFSMLNFFRWVFFPKYLVPSTENSYFGKKTEFFDKASKVL